MKEFFYGGVVAALFFIQAIWMDFIFLILLGGISIVILLILIQKLLELITQIISWFTQKQAETTLKLIRTEDD